MEGDVMDKVEATATVRDFDPISGSIPATKVEITVSCRNLLDRDTFSKSDPLVVLYTQGVETKQWREFGRTEVIDNTLNPDFVRKYILDYFFEEKQNLRFDVYDIDSKSPDLAKHDCLKGEVLCCAAYIQENSSLSQPNLTYVSASDVLINNCTMLTIMLNSSRPLLVTPRDPFECSHPTSLSRSHFMPSSPWQDFLGQVFCTLGEIVGSPASRLEKPLGGIPGKKCGTVILSAEELGNCRDYATMQFCANKLDKKDFFGKSDPFMVFYRSNEDGTFTICHKTEVVKNTLNPVWEPFSIPVRALCNGDYDRTIKVEVYDWDRDGSHDFIGEFTTSFKELCRGQNQLNVYEVVNAKKKIKKKRYINSGTVSLLSFSVESEHTFLDYIRGGTQIHFTVAIDFTASNGNPSQSTSLHYMNPYQMNAYAMALKAVGEIIQDYDSDKMFPALGFGAKLPPDWRVSHEFPLNGNVDNPYCNGMEGILEAYHQSLKTVQLYGPTNFAPVVNHVARYAAAVQDGSQYFVLLIITDGVISDMAQTKEAIVNAAKLPMSIIIVGVGQAEFDAMVELDGDDVRISSRGKVAERDIVQFVPFRDYMDRTGNHVLSMARLAKDVLAEIPDQLISYMKSRAIKPNPVPVYSPSDEPPTNPV
uniref:Copine Va n=2 Tax=Pseudocrenilabrinae TaxID=318546 RepID=A0A3Q2X508_HAPBU